MHVAEEWKSELEDWIVEIIATDQNKEIRMKINEESLRDIWDNIKHINVRFIEVPEGEEKEKGPEKIFEEIIAENVHKMGKETNKSWEFEFIHKMDILKVWSVCREYTGAISITQFE